MSEEKKAKALGNNLNVSPKSCNEICYNIKGKMAEKAVKWLERVENKEDFVTFRRFITGINHRKKGKIGRFPIKAAKLVKKVVKNAIANAEFKELESKKLKITHASAYKTLTLHRIRPKGKARPNRIDLTNIEIGVTEV